MKALLKAMSMDVSFALGRRSKCRRCSVESTIAMFIGTFIEWDFWAHADEISFAAWWVRRGTWVVRAGGEEDEGDMVVLNADVARIGFCVLSLAGQLAGCLSGLVK